MLIYERKNSLSWKFFLGNYNTINAVSRLFIVSFQCIFICCFIFVYVPCVSLPSVQLAVLLLSQLGNKKQLHITVYTKFDSSRWAQLTVVWSPKPEKDNQFFSSLTCPGAHPNTYSVDTRPFFLGMKWSGPETDHSFLSSTADKNEWRFTSALPIRHCGVYRAIYQSSPYW